MYKDFKSSASLHVVSWEPEWHYHYSTIFWWEPEGCYGCTKSMVIAPFWFSTEHHWTALMPFWISADRCMVILSQISCCSTMCWYFGYTNWAAHIPWAISQGIHCVPNAAPFTNIVLLSYHLVSYLDTTLNPRNSFMFPLSFKWIMQGYDTLLSFPQIPS